jgi:hypothetical protein
VKIKFKGTSDYGNDDIGVDQVKVYNFNPAGPIISVNPGVLNFGSVLFGNNSTEKTYSLSGTGLGAGPVTVTAPAGFKVSRTTGGPYTSSVTVIYLPPTLPATTIYVRFTPEASNTTYSDNITNSGGGATANVIVTGSSPCDPVSLDYCQDFPEAGFPTCWTEQLEGLITTSHWSMVNTNIAGGTAYEAQATFEPGDGATEADNDRLVSPPLNTVGKSSIHVSFRQMLNDYNAGVNDVWIKVQSSSDGTHWTDEWVYGGGLGVSIPAEVKELDITNNLGGTTWIAWTLAGFTYDINYWYVDDICISVPLLHDAKTVSIDNLPGLIASGSIIAPKATVKNAGSTASETFDVTMTTTGYSSTVTGVTLASGAQTQVTFDNWTPSDGSYIIDVCTQLTGDLNPGNDCQSKVVTIKVPAKMYGYVASDPIGTNPAGPAYFYDTSPDVINSLAASTSTQFIQSGTWAEGVWYGAEYFDATGLSGGGWYTMNITTGAMTKLADLGRSFAGLTYDHNSGILYGVDWDGTTNSLYTIDPPTGAATLIGTFMDGELMINLATNGSGFLYSLGITTDHLFQIDPVTLNVVDIGATGLALNYGQDMEYNYASSTMYAATYTTYGALYSVDLNTGECTLANTFQNGSEITGLAIPYCTSSNKWTGNVSNDWTDPGNWTCGTVPDQSVTVFIPSVPAGGVFPVIASGITADCYDVTLETGAVIKVETGGTLNVKIP